ncbi:MAG: immunoglobulin-like domain-containing protein [Acidobacteriota bacterium]
MAPQPPVSRLRARVPGQPEMPPRERSSEGQPDEPAPRGRSELNVERRGHVAVALDQRRVLFIGGENDRGLVKESELFDLGSRSFSLAAELISPRTDAVALRLANGRILVLGGRNHRRELRSTEIYDSASNSFIQGPKMVHARTGHTATLLEDGRLLVIGGDTEGSAEILDPSAKRFSLIAARLNTRRAFHSAVVLQSGKVLIAGGRNAEGDPEASAEICDPKIPTFSSMRNSMGTRRVRPTLRVLSDGNVQVIGGDDGRSMEMFNSEGRYFTALAYLAPDSNSPEKISQVLRCETRVALLHKADRDSVVDKPGRSILLEDPRWPTEPSSDLLDRGDYTLTEIPGSGTALVAGGMSSAGKTLSSMVAFESSAATVATDETDYSPGETVIITGANWQAGEIVQLTLHRDNDTPDTLLSALADDSGNISNSDYVVQESDLDVTFLLTAVGQASGFTAQTTFTDQSNLITQIGFNTVSQPASFTVGVPNATSSPLRVQSRNAIGAGEAVTGSGNSVTIQVTSNWATGRFDTSSGGTFTATSLTLQINAGSQNTPDFFYRETTAGSVTLIAAVTATTGVNNLPINSASSIAKPVNKANTTTSVASGAANPLQCGQSVTFTATVAHATSGGAGAPTGAVTFKDGATTLGTGTLSAGPIFTAAFTTSSLSLGSHSITAVYGPDSNFNGSTSAILSRTVSDDQPPIITLNGANPLTVECHMPYTEPGAIATDTCAGDLTNSIVATGSINPNVVGVYTVHYDVSDPTGNSSGQATRTVSVVDTTPPTLSLVGASAFTVECHTSFIDPGATATDICAGDLIGSIVVAGTVNANAIGIYTVHYSVSDPAGNPALQATRMVNVVDTTPPTLSLVGANPFIVECRTSFIDPGATAHDSCDASLTTATSSGSVNVNVPGDYIVTYSASDASGNAAATVTRTVQVQDTTPPSITLSGASPFNVECHTSFTDPGAIASDSCDSGLTAATASGSVNVNVPGDYFITYNASDASNNHAVPVTRDVHVVDTTPPVPNLTTLPTITGECSATATVNSPPTATDTCAGMITATTADPLGYNTEGTFTVHWTYDDGHGNISTQTQTVVVDDTIAPVPNVASLAPVPGQCSATVTAPTATDNCSGSITATTTNPLTYNTEGTFTLLWTYDDGHGNISTQTQTVVVDDTIAPVPNVASLAPVTGQCSAAVTAPTATDNCSSAITGTTSDPLVYSTQGTFTVHWTYNDGHGNMSSQTQTVNVNDTIAPTITSCALPQALAAINGQAIVPSFTGGVAASDNCTPAASLLKMQAPSAGTTVGPGNYSITITVKDAANNPTTCTSTFSVVYNFAGFFAPIDNLPVVNIAKAGSAIPIKFSLGGYQGLNIFDPGNPGSAPITCDFGAPAEAVDETVNAGGSSLNYDSTVDRYIYVWKTEKSWANSCRLLVVKLRDGSIYRANFRFVK